MAAQIRTSMAAILPLLEARLQEVTGLPRELINPWIGDRNGPRLGGDHDLLVRLKGMNPLADWQHAGGRHTMHIAERIEVCVRTRLQLDPAGSAREWLINQTYGHIALRDLVITALEEFIPTDSDDNALLTGAMHLQTTPAPAPEPGSGPKSAPDWGEERLAYTVSYLQDFPEFAEAEE